MDGPPRRRGRPLKTPVPSVEDGANAEEIERLRGECARLAGVEPSAMSDEELQDVIVWQSSGDPRKWPRSREMLQTSRAMWLAAKGEGPGHLAWRKSLEQICRRGRGQAE